MPLKNILRNKYLPVLICLQLLAFNVKSQHVYYNTPYGFYEIIYKDGLCTKQVEIPYNAALVSGNPYSIAVFKDTLYFITSGVNNVYRMKIGDPNSCEYLGKMAPPGEVYPLSVNSFVADRNGMLYGIDANYNSLIFFNPYTKEVKRLGHVPLQPAGDMIFYKNKLMYAASNGGIYEVNIAHPEQSTLYMSAPGYFFFGVISLPYSCNKNKVYGISVVSYQSAFVELDLDNKKIVKTECYIPVEIYDAASNNDAGLTNGITLNSSWLQLFCNNGNIHASINAIGTSTTEGAVTYTLDNKITNTTGLFDNIGEGQHHFFIKNAAGCTYDTVFNIVPDNLAVKKVDITTANNCNMSNGAVLVSAASIYSPLNYAIDNAGNNNTGSFKKVKSGNHLLNITDAAGCAIDTAIVVDYKQPPKLVSAIEITGAGCRQKTGSLKIEPSAEVADWLLYTKLNNGTQQQVLFFGNLDTGTYALSVFDTTGCRFDTTIVIGYKDKPKLISSIQVTATTCLLKSGAINISPAAGISYNVLSASLNNNTPQASLFFQGLDSGKYMVSVVDTGGCKIDTTVVVGYRQLPKPSYDILATNAVCELSNGSFTIKPAPGNAQSIKYAQLGNGTPQTFLYFNGLDSGRYTLTITDTAGCKTDTTLIIGNQPLPKPDYTITSTNANCALNNGSVTVKPTPGVQSIKYAQLGNGTPQTSLYFNALDSGKYTLFITDTAGCKTDTVVTIGYDDPSRLVKTINTTSTNCSLQNGSINIIVDATQTQYAFYVSINNGAKQPLTNITNLDAGAYTLNVFAGESCKIADTIVKINKTYDAKPVIQTAITNQVCDINNGSVTISATGNEQPYLFNFNNGGYSGNNIFNTLYPGIYNINIKNKNGCTWDTAVIVKPYDKGSYTTTVNKVNPTCDNEQSGMIILNANGTTSPYTFTFNGRKFAAGDTLQHLGAGTYNLPVLNKDGCNMGTSQVTLQLAFSRDCDTVYVPTAFTPNGDGKNDYLKPFYSSFSSILNFSVYNRWGQQVYTMGNSKTSGWNGYYQSRLQPAGTYIWICQYKNHNGREIVKRGTTVLLY